MKKTFTDFLGRNIEIEFPPKRIISLVPSQTELILDLIGTDRLIGITKFCVHPKDKTSKISKIGGTKNPNIKQIESLKPDLIIANKEENELSDIAEISKFCPVWVSEISDFEDSMKMIAELGIIFQESDKAQQIIEQINLNRNLLQQKKIELKFDREIIYLIWKNPWMAAGKDTFINSMLSDSGFKNSIKKERYPQITLDEIADLNPEMILLSSEPYPFSQKHVELLKKELPNCEIILVNGEYFSWYGNRLIAAYQYFTELIQSISKKTNRK